MSGQAGNRDVASEVAAGRELGDAEYRHERGSEHDPPQQHGEPVFAADAVRREQQVPSQPASRMRPRSAALTCVADIGDLFAETYEASTEQQS